MRASQWVQSYPATSQFQQFSQRLRFFNVPSVSAGAKIPTVPFDHRNDGGSPFENRSPKDLAFEGGRVFVKADGAAKGVPFDNLLFRADLRLVSGRGKSKATIGNPKPKFSTHSFGCHFVEVTWQPEIAQLRVSRVVTVMDGEAPRGETKVQFLRLARRRTFPHG